MSRPIVQESLGLIQCSRVISFCYRNFCYSKAAPRQWKYCAVINITQFYWPSSLNIEGLDNIVSQSNEVWEFTVKTLKHGKFCGQYCWIPIQLPTVCRAVNTSRNKILGLQDYLQWPSSLAQWVKADCELLHLVCYYLCSKSFERISSTDGPSNSKKVFKIIWLAEPSSLS